MGFAGFQTAGPMCGCCGLYSDAMTKSPGTVPAIWILSTSPPPDNGNYLLGAGAYALLNLVPATAAVKVEVAFSWSIDTSNAHLWKLPTSRVIIGMAGSLGSPDPNNYLWAEVVGDSFDPATWDGHFRGQIKIGKRVAGVDTTIRTSGAHLDFGTGNYFLFRVCLQPGNDPDYYTPPTNWKISTELKATDLTLTLGPLVYDLSANVPDPPGKMTGIASLVYQTGFGGILEYGGGVGTPFVLSKITFACPCSGPPPPCTDVVFVEPFDTGEVISDHWAQESGTWTLTTTPHAISTNSGSALLIEFIDAPVNTGRVQATAALNTAANAGDVRVIVAHTSSSSFLAVEFTNAVWDGLKLTATIRLLEQGGSLSILQTADFLTFTPSPIISFDACWNGFYLSAAVSDQAFGSDPIHNEVRLSGATGLTGVRAGLGTGVTAPTGSALAFQSFSYNSLVEDESCVPCNSCAHSCADEVPPTIEVLLPTLSDTGDGTCATFCSSISGSTVVLNRVTNVKPWPLFGTLEHATESCAYIHDYGEVCVDGTGAPISHAFALIAWFSGDNDFYGFSPSFAPPPNSEWLTVALGEYAVGDDPSELLGFGAYTLWQVAVPIRSICSGITWTLPLLFQRSSRCPSGVPGSLQATT